MPQTTNATFPSAAPPTAPHPLCALCNESVLYPNPNPPALPALLLDDIVLNNCPAAHHFHWDCITSHASSNIDWCPACLQASPNPPPDSAYVASPIGQILASVTTTEGGTVPDYDIKPDMLAERAAPFPRALEVIRARIEQAPEPAALQAAIAQFPPALLVAALFETCAAGDPAGLLELLALMPSPADTAALARQPLNAAVAAAVPPADPEDLGSAAYLCALRDISTVHTWTPLCEAAASGRKYMVSILLQACPDMPAQELAAAAQVATAAGRPDIAALLV